MSIAGAPSQGDLEAFVKLRMLFLQHLARTVSGVVRGLHGLIWLEFS
jgi:hypothetical protein